MRKATRRKYYGRSNIAQSLHAAVDSLKAALREAEHPQETPLSQNIRQVIKELHDAVQYYELYGMGRKRLKSALLRETKHLEQLVKDVTSLPVFQEEKILARRKRKENRGAN